MNISELHSGDNVFVIQRNPHTQSVAHIQEAHVVDNPYSPGQLALFFAKNIIHYQMSLLCIQVMKKQNKPMMPFSTLIIHIVMRIRFRRSTNNDKAFRSSVSLY